MLVKMGRTGLLMEPHHGPQAGKSGDPHSQDADKNPRKEGVGFKRKMNVDGSYWKHE